MRDLVCELGARIVAEEELERFGDPARLCLIINIPRRPRTRRRVGC
jgi:hypothetical protein